MKLLSFLAHKRCLFGRLAPLSEFAIFVINYKHAPCDDDLGKDRNSFDARGIQPICVENIGGLLK